MRDIVPDSDSMGCVSPVRVDETVEFDIAPLN